MTKTDNKTNGRTFPRIEVGAHLKKHSIIIVE
jgi:hypothetical protein